MSDGPTFGGAGLQKYSCYTLVTLRYPIQLHGLVHLCHRRWTIRLIAAIDEGAGRFAVLMRKLGVARQTLRRALDAAIENYLW